MTTAEVTMDLISQLSEPEMLSVQGYIKRIFANRKKRSELRPITKEEFLESIKESENDINEGRVKSWERVRAETYEKYGL